MATETIVHILIFLGGFAILPGATIADHYFGGEGGGSSVAIGCLLMILAVIIDLIF